VSHHRTLHRPDTPYGDAAGVILRLAASFFSSAMIVVKDDKTFELAK